MKEFERKENIRKRGKQREVKNNERWRNTVYCNGVRYKVRAKQEGWSKKQWHLFIGLEVGKRVYRECIQTGGGQWSQIDVYCDAISVIELHKKAVRVLCDYVLWCTVLRCAMMCCTALWCTVLCYAMMYCAFACYLFVLISSFLNNHVRDAFTHSRGERGRGVGVQGAVADEQSSLLLICCDSALYGWLIL